MNYIYNLSTGKDLKIVLGLNKRFAFTLHIQKKLVQVLAMQYGGNVYFKNCTQVERINKL